MRFSASTAYTDHLGTKVVAAADLAAALHFAASWSAEEARAAAWHAYARVQALLAWDYAIGLVRKVQPNVIAAMHDPTFAQTLPTFVALVTTPIEVGKRAAATRRRIRSATDAVKKEATKEVTPAVAAAPRA